ncbi:MAG: DUF1592 domain-containing protein [Planctomycetales bacterium]|nr:DUF1592 domain-containing protein [Planctomycetales bacterium]
MKTLLERNCAECHRGSEAEGGLDVAALSADLGNRVVGAKWARIVDRVAAGEMPPADATEMSDEQRRQWVASVGGWIRQVQTHEFQQRGRVEGRRLTNLQLERSLHELLGIDIPLASRMPEEPRVGGFTTVADGQPMSHFQLEQHLSVVDAALDEAFRRAAGPEDEWQRELSAREIVRRNPRRRTREPEMLRGDAVVWSSRLIFYGRIPATTAREDGWYQFKIRAKSLKQPDDGVWCTVRSGPCVASAPLLSWLGAFSAGEEAREWTFTGWVPKGHMLEVRPGDLTLKGARFQGGQVGAGEGEPQNVPGVAIESIEMRRIHIGPDNSQVRELLFADLPLKAARPVRVESQQPRADLKTLIHRFASRAFRRPVDDEVVAPYVELALSTLDAGADLTAAVRAGYRAILCSPRFLYLHEEPGRLDDFALATRLSLMLWNCPPDTALRQVAESGTLKDPGVLRQQVERMLQDPRGQHFVEDLASEWLDLRLIDFTEPDRRLYPGFDVIVQNAMLAETHAFLREMLAEDRAVTHLIDSDHTFLNNRLARHYGIAGVDGDELRSVSLKPGDHRGGLLTQGAILKVTANGTTTSPVIRGVWVSDRLLGAESPAPPENVPAIEPDIRGATSIRDQLARHKSDSSCASCHRKIDPPGFALENFDPAGRWRERYGSPAGPRRGPRNPGLRIDASSELPDGRSFQGIETFKALICDDPATLARNVAEKLITYGTGAPVAYADREEIHRIVSKSAASDYGFRTLLHAVVASQLFQTK